MENNNEHTRKAYKINEGDVITVIRNDATWQDKPITFYKVGIKNRLDDSQTYYKQLKFPTGTDLKDGTRIKINAMTEYARHKDKFTDLFYLYISDFEIVGGNTSEAINEYKEELANMNENIF